jgi:hypothetical protein
LARASNPAHFFCLSFLHWQISHLAQSRINTRCSIPTTAHRHLASRLPPSVLNRLDETASPLFAPRQLHVRINGKIISILLQYEKSRACKRKPGQRNTTSGDVNTAVPQRL